MADSAKLTHVVDIVLGDRMMTMLLDGMPAILAFESLNLQVRVTLDEETKKKYAANGSDKDGKKD